MIKKHLMMKKIKNELLINKLNYVIEKYPIKTGHIFYICI